MSKYSVINSNGLRETVEADLWKIKPPGVLVFYKELYPGDGEIIEEPIFAYGTGAWEKVVAL